MSFASVVGPNLLIAIRDGLRALHRSSIQIAGPGPAPGLIAPDRIHHRRAFVSEVCHSFICNRELSPTNRLKCDGWDAEAASHCADPDTPLFEQKCHAGFSCLSQGIYYLDPKTKSQTLLAMIFAGERLVKGEPDRLPKIREDVLETLEADIAASDRPAVDSTFLRAEFRDAWTRSEKNAAISRDEWRALKNSLGASARFLGNCYVVGLSGPVSSVEMIGRALADLSDEDRVHLLPVVTVGLLGVNARWRSFFDHRNPGPGEGSPIPSEGFVIRAELVAHLTSLDAIDALCIEMIRDLLEDVALRGDVTCIPDSTGVTAVFAQGDSPQASAREILGIARRWASWSKGPEGAVRVCCGLSRGVVACGPHSLNPLREPELEDFEANESGPASMWSAVGRPVLAARRVAAAAQFENAFPAVGMDNAFRSKLPLDLQSRFSRVITEPGEVGSDGGKDGPSPEL